MGARRSLPQDSVGVFRNVFDLNTGHWRHYGANSATIQVLANRPMGSSRALPDWESLTLEKVRDMTICPPRSDN